MSELMATREAFGEELTAIMRDRGEVVALTADLGESLRMLNIREEMPERFFDCGVAEANMVGVAAGMALRGLRPVAGTFAVFLTRAFDHIRMQVCQNNLPVVIVGSHGGVSNALDGGSAHALEDLAYMRTMPNMTVLNPMDGPSMRAALRAAVTYNGPVYVRAYREPTPVVAKDAVFKIGGSLVLREGEDISIVATGPQAAFALEAAEILKAGGVMAEVVAVQTLQPFDAKMVLASAAKTERVLTVEDHSVNGGLGSAVAEVLSEGRPTRLRRLGLRQFGESGKYADLIAKLGIDSDGIARSAAEFLAVNI